MKSDFTLAFNEILETRALSKEVVLEALQQALISAYRRDANLSSSKQQIEARIDLTGKPEILLEKEVVDQVMNPRTEVELEVAQEHIPDCELGDMVMVPVTDTSASFGRIAAQTAKQVILQRIREAERETLYDEFIEREGDLITGTVQSVSHGVVTLSLGRAEAIMPRAHQMRGERYRPHEKIRTYVVEVNKSTRGPQIVVSRTHKDMLRRLLEYEVPEIYNGQVEIKNIAREAGYRSKVAVAALQEGVDPVGACVGMRGMRIQSIIKELNDEKIDVIEWSADPARFIEKALSPARVSGVYLDESIDQVRTATVVVLGDHLSLAIGREGQNARLAAKLTGWRIDIKSVSEAAREGYAALERAPFDVIKQDRPELVIEINRILEKMQANRPIMPEEYTTLIRFVDLIESRKVESMDVEREVRRETLAAVRPLVPEAAFHMPLATLELADDIVKALGRIDNVGDLMIRVLAEEDRLTEMLKDNQAGDDAMEAIRYALDDLVIPEIYEVDESAATEVEVEAIEVVAEEDEEVIEPAAVEVEAAILDETVAEGEEEVLPAFVEPEPIVEAVDDVTRKDKRLKQSDDDEDSQEEAVADEIDFMYDYGDETDEVDADGKQTKKGKKAKQRRVQLVYDEDLGEVVAKRRRKGSRRRDIDEYALGDDFE
jgi:N utilization substance protein A